MATPKLFTPTKVGNNTLQHCVVFAPTTRLRADDKHVPIVELVAEHYAQRAAVPGTLLIAEGTLISPQAGGFGNAPGIWSKEQVSAWKQVVDAVHERGSFIYVQLAAIGRAALLDVLEKDGGHPLVSSSDVLLTGASAPPRPLSVEEIKQYVEDFATAAYNAVHGAGFDGVEIHGANGYLIDQFIQDNANKRTDTYGGSIENRARFVLEIADAVVAKVGAEKTALRYPNFGFIHVVEPRVDAYTDREPGEDESNDFIRKIWSPRPLISAGGYNRELSLEVAETKGDLIAWGRYYTSNPDLPLRLKKNLPLAKYDRNTFYNATEALGYNDHPYAPENEAELGKIPILRPQV